MADIQGLATGAKRGLQPYTGYLFNEAQAKQQSKRREVARQKQAKRKLQRLGKAAQLEYDKKKKLEQLQFERTKERLIDAAEQGNEEEVYAALGLKTPKQKEAVSTRADAYSDYMTGQAEYQKDLLKLKQDELDYKNRVMNSQMDRKNKNRELEEINETLQLYEVLQKLAPKTGGGIRYNVPNVEGLDTEQKMRAGKWMKEPERTEPTPQMGAVRDKLYSQLYGYLGLPKEKKKELENKGMENITIGPHLIRAFLEVLNQATKGDMQAQEILNSYIQKAQQGDIIAQRVILEIPDAVKQTVNAINTSRGKD